MLARMSDEKFDDEVAYWQDIRRVGGPAQIETADFMLGRVLEYTDLCRKSVHLSEAVRQEIDIMPIFRDAIAGLALSQLIRRSAQSFIERASFGFGRFVAIEAIATEQTPFMAQMHVARDRVREVLPAFEPNPPLTWYADENAGLAVRAKHPAAPTPTFEQHFLGVTGNEFQPHKYVALRPFLLNSFVEAG